MEVLDTWSKGRDDGQRGVATGLRGAVLFTDCLNADQRLELHLSASKFEIYILYGFIAGVQRRLPFRGDTLGKHHRLFIRGQNDTYRLTNRVFAGKVVLPETVWKTEPTIYFERRPISRHSVCAGDNRYAGLVC